VSHRVRTGRLHRRHRGVYSVGHARLSQEGEWLAAVLAAGEGAALSHLSAAKLWNVWRRAVRGIDVLAPRRRQVNGVRVHTARRLDPCDMTVHNGIPVTTVPRTLVDLAEVLTAHQLANVIHEASFRNRFSSQATRAAMERANGRNRRALDQALALNAAGSAGTKSDLEDRFLDHAQAARSGPRSSTPPFRPVSAAMRWTSAGATCAWRSTGPVTAERARRPRTRRGTAP
jgi:hypothetical protein